MRKFYLHIALVFSILYSCEPYEVQESLRPKLAVYSLLRAGKMANARIEFTRDISDTLRYAEYKPLVDGWY